MNMSTFKFALLGLLHLLASSALGSECPPDDVSKLVVCYYEGKTSLSDFNLCKCSHVVLTNAVKRAQVNNISTTEDAVKHLEIIKERKKDLSAIFTLEKKEDDVARILKSKNRTEELVNAVSDFLQESHFDGVEVNFQFQPDDGVSKESFAYFLKTLKKALSSHHRRIKRGSYDVFEKLDDITTAAYTTQTPKNSTARPQSIKQRNRKRKDIDGEIRKESEDDAQDADYLTLEEPGTPENQTTLADIEEDVFEEKNLLLFVRLPLKLEIIAKKYDLKAISRYADVLVVPTHNIISSNEAQLTYHPSRLMGLADILNTDSILDFLTGMGGLKSKMVITLPATVLKFELKDENENTPRAPARSKPQVIDQSQLCTLFSKGNWTVERDDDLTAPYAFSGKTWLAFEDETSVNIKGKYILLRELAGGAIYPIDADLSSSLCPNRTGPNGFLTGILRGNFESLGRKPRALVLESLQEEIHDTAYVAAEAGVKLSEYRIVRVVDHTGAVHVIRKNTKTQFECSRQGYFSHPLGCNKFYRCVKFDQYSDEFTVFEYDCPAGLAFDERWEVCVWPGSLPHGAPCTGSSEIAPVPRSHYRCPNQEGYYADPENCRWFFACLDHARDGVTPLTAYEFRCPFGLVFNEERLACDWPWLVGSCGNRGAAGFLRVNAGGQSQGIHSATFINGGNLEASLGQFGNAEAASFINFGSEFGSVLKGAKYNAGGSYRSSQSPGLGYIGGQFNEDHNRASFASFPDYEVSGGRIVNKGGVVLSENIAGVSGAAAAAGSVGENVLKSFESSGRGFGRGGGYLNQELKSGGVFYNGAATTVQPLEPIQTNALKISGVISKAHVQEQNPISTPKPFSVSIPSVQINSEYSGPSTAGPATAQNIHFTATSPETEIVDFHQQQQGFIASQPAVSVSVPFVTPSTTHRFGDILSHSSPVGISSTSFGTTPKSETFEFKQAGYKQSEFLSNIHSNAAGVSTGAAVAVGEQSSGHSLSNGIENKPLTVSVPVVTPKPELHSFDYTSVGGATAFYKPKATTETPFTDFIRQDQAIAHQISEGRGLGISSAFSQIPGVRTHNFKTSGGVEVNSVSGTGAVGEVGVFYGAPLATVAPKVHSGKGSTDIGPGVRVSVASPRPTLISYQQSSIDEKVSNELYLNTPQPSLAVPHITPKVELFSKPGSVTVGGNAVSSKISVVTPQPEFHFSQSGQNALGITSKSKPALPYNYHAVTPQVGFDLQEEHGGVQGGTPVVPSSFSELTTLTGNGFVQTGSEGVLKEFPRVSFSTPVVTPRNELRAFEQKEDVSQAEKTSYSVPALTSGVKTDGVIQVGVSRDILRPTVFQSGQQPVYGQRYSFEHFANNFGLSRGISSTLSPTTAENPVPKIQDTKVFIQHQPIASVGTISSVTADLTASTPQPLQQNVPVSHTDFKSGYNQQVSVSTPAPVVSITPPVSSTYKPPQQFLNVFAKSSQPVTIKQQQEGIAIDTTRPVLQQTFVNTPDIAFHEKSSNLFKQEFQSFTPVISSVTEKEFSSGFGTKSNFYEKSGTYTSAVTPKVEITGPTIQQSFQPPRKQLQFTQHQVTTTAPEYEQREKTEGSVITIPQEKLVGLEITKSVELNPSQFFGSSDKYSSQESFAKSIEIQQRPLHLISQKEFQNKQLVQPFFGQQEKEIEGNSFGKQFSFHQVVNVETPKTEFGKQKPYFPPGVTSAPHLSTATQSTTKTVSFGRPFTYSEGSDIAVPALPVFEASKVAITSEKEASKTGYLPPAVKSPVQTVFAGQQQGRFSPKPNLLLPTAPTIAQFASPVTEEITIRNSYDFGKINENVSPLVQNIFPQAETHLSPEASLDVFGTSGRLFQYKSAQNLTGIGDSAGKYAINPKIAIPEPPKEYVLLQNGVTTAAPEFPTTSSSQDHLQSTTRGLFRGSTYLPPALTSRRKQSKATLISVGNLDEEDIRDGRAQQLFDKYSGRFGEVIGGRNGKIATKLVKGNAKGEIAINEPRASSVQYEISSPSRQPSGQERQYHGGITSGLRASNKYEEYEINGVGDGQRSLNNAGDSKTTLDLKNLKLDKNKKTVIVVSQVSDANPILVGKLAGQCSCQSNMLEIRSKGRKSESSRGNKNSPQRSNISNKFLPPYETAAAVDTPRQGAASTAAPETVIIGDSKTSRLEVTHTPEQHYISSSTTVLPDLVAPTILSSLGPNGVLSITPKTVYAEEKPLTEKKQFRGRARYLPPSYVLQEKGSPSGLASAVTASEIASTFDYSILRGDESRNQNEIDEGDSFGPEKKGAGAAFDRYGPGGWRGFDEVLQGSVDCKRPGLFRHPKYCNKFYACNYDPWKERYTLHVFNCPIQLTYDSSISACNWPVRGPACADDNLLV